jgi:hypothetical protein
MFTKAQVFLLAFSKNMDHYDLSQKIKIFNFSCEHFDHLIPESLFDSLEHNLNNIFIHKPLIKGKVADESPDQNDKMDNQEHENIFISFGFYYCYYYHFILHKHVPVSNFRILLKYFNTIFSTNSLSRISGDELDILKSINQFALKQKIPDQDLIAIDHFTLNQVISSKSGNA